MAAQRAGRGSQSRVLADKAGGRMAKMRAALHIGSVYDEWHMYSANADDYSIGAVIGLGASSIVYEGTFKPLGKACAIKVIDLEAYGRDSEGLRRETQLMSLSKHPNVLRVRGCWVKGAKLHIATRLMSSGSMLDILRFAYQQGFDETVIATVLKQALEGLNYLHINGWLHRDLKAANILVDDDGTVLLGDFGVGVFVGDPTDTNEGKRKSFVGTPCWMAPEVIERKHYDAKADIWSFGITTLELATGHAPNSLLNPVKVLMRTMQDAPPTLDRKGGVYKYSTLMDDFVRSCLQKDPDLRPTAEVLLSHAFLKQAKAPKYLVTAILDELPPLVDRQERRRRASSSMTQNSLSWDFESNHSRTDFHPDDTDDPFRNFSGIASPPGNRSSIRSAKLVSIDGVHVLASEIDVSRSSRSHGSSSVDELPRRVDASASRRHRSSDASRLRKPVSLDALDSAIGVGTALTSGSWLAPIGERTSPHVGPVVAEVGNIPTMDLAKLATPDIPPQEALGSSSINIALVKKDVPDAIAADRRSLDTNVKEASLTSNFGTSSARTSLGTDRSRRVFSKIFNRKETKA